jgi:Zn finger protein HypA/HybF involved in hydrogenase expression
MTIDQKMESNTKFGQWLDVSFKYIGKGGTKIETGHLTVCSGCGIISDPLYVYCPYCGQKNVRVIEGKEED